MTYKERLESERMKLDSVKNDFIELITEKIKTKYDDLEPDDRINISSKMFFYADMPNRIEA